MVYICVATIGEFRSTRQAWCHHGHIFFSFAATISLASAIAPAIDCCPLGLAKLIQHHPRTPRPMFKLQYIVNWRRNTLQRVLHPQKSTKCKWFVCRWCVVRPHWINAFGEGIVLFASSDFYWEQWGEEAIGESGGGSSVGDSVNWTIRLEGDRLICGCQMEMTLFGFLQCGYGLWVNVLFLNLIIVEFIGKHQNSKICLNAYNSWLR